MKKLIVFLLALQVFNARGQKIELGIPLGHESGISQLLLTNDRHLYISTAFGDKEALVWNAKDGKMLRRLSGHETSISNCILISDSLLLTTASKEVRLWNLTDGSSQILLNDFFTIGLYKLKGNRILISNQTELKYITYSVTQKQKSDTQSTKLSESISGYHVNFEVISVKADKAFAYFHKELQYDSFLVCSDIDYRSRGRKTTKTRIINLETGKCILDRNEKVVFEGLNRWFYPRFQLYGTGLIQYKTGFGNIEKFNSNGEKVAQLQLDSGYPRAMSISPDSAYIAVLTEKSLLLLSAKDLSIKFSSNLALNSYKNHQYEQLYWDPNSNWVYFYSGYGYGVLSLKMNVHDGRTEVLKEHVVRFIKTKGPTFVHTGDSKIYHISDTLFSTALFRGIASAGIDNAWIISQHNRRIDVADTLIRIIKFSTSELIRSIAFDANDPPVTDTVNGFVYYRNKESRLNGYDLKNDSITEFNFEEALYPSTFTFSPDAQYLFSYRDAYPVPCAENEEPTWGEECEELPLLSVYKMPGFKLIRSIADTMEHFYNLDQAAFIDTPYRGIAVFKQTETGTDIFVYAYVFNSAPVYTIHLKFYGGDQLFRFGPDGHQFIIDNQNDLTTDFYDLNGEKWGSFNNIESGLEISSDGEYYIVKNYEGLFVFNSSQRSALYKLDVSGDEAEITFIDSNTKMLIYDYSDLLVVELATGKILGKANKLNSTVVWAQLISATRLAVLTSDNVYSVWDMVSGEWLIKKYNFGSKNLTIVPSGLFDSDVSEFSELYWVQGMETIEFSQLKDRYWEPGLWEKWLKNEKIRDVSQMQGLKLHPEIEIGESVGLKVPVTVIKRDGGLGKISVFVNGKEVIADLRKQGLDTSLMTQTIWIDLEGSPYLQANGDNKITFRAWSADGFVSSRGENIVLRTKSVTAAQPALYGIICGISTYANQNINLRYSVTDALAIHKAMQLAGGNLFHPDSVHLFLATSDTGITPDKQGIRSVFKEISKLAKAEDVIVVYLSGHGITSSGENADFYYLTRDAFSASGDSYSDPAIRAATSISSSEMIEWMNEIHANKQFMVIDACGSGKAVENLIARRSVDASQIKAIDRMRENAGMHIISGCAADAVSYEASVFGQGLLTYSLLEAMKGGALRQEKFLDVSLLMQYSLDRVPSLASDIGGIQKPQVLSPKGAQSFDIGMLGSADKSKIPLAQPKPVFIRSLIVTKTLRDPLGITGMANDILQYGIPGKEQPWVFFDSPNFPNAYQITGFYSTNEQNNITMEMSILKGEVEVMSKTISAAGMEQLKVKLRQELLSLQNK